MKLNLPGKPSEGPGFGDASFLPEDYVAQRAQRRTNVLSVALFIVITLGVVGAFLVTNREWNGVKKYQEAINVRYTQAAKDIEQLKVLEKQKAELLEKAELTTALIEKVPRSILLAELINRMPAPMVLVEFELSSTRVDRPVVQRQVGDKKSFQNGGNANNKEDEAPTVLAPEFEVFLVLTGITPSHRDVAAYVSELQDCELLRGVELIFSEGTYVQQTPMNRFRVEARVRMDADARAIEPLENPRLDPRRRQVAPDPEELIDELRADAPVTGGD